VKVTAGGKPVEAAFISINSDMGQTDFNGLLNISLKKTMKGGTYNITATKLGYQKTSKEIVIQGYVENRLSIEAPPKGNQFGNITIKVLNKDIPVSGATVSFDNKEIGVTDAKGLLEYRLDDSGIHTIYASMSGFTSAARDIEVRVPFAEFNALDIRVNDVIFTNQQAEIRANITNIGTKASTLPVALIINSTEVASIPIDVSPGEIKDITFRQDIKLPPGNYTIEVLGQKKLVEVKEAPFNVFLALGVIIVIGAVVIYFLTAKGKLSLDAIKKKPPEIKKQSVDGEPKKVSDDGSSKSSTEPKK
jgi:hypothetical protein